MKSTWLSASNQGGNLLSSLLFVSLISPAGFRPQAGVYDPATLVPGGVSGSPVITNVVPQGQQCTVHWKGYAGPYQLYKTHALDSGEWQKAGLPVIGSSVTVPADATSFFRVAGTPPVFGAAVSCGDCHKNLYPTWTNTTHAHALETLKGIGQGTNPRCLTCHTVGYGFPSGFTSETATPFYAGVQCANCHGPSGNHYIYPTDPARRPMVSLSAEICGGCHQDFHHPYYEEWSQSGHGFVSEDVAESMITGGEARMNSCGPCHSGAVRMALLKGEPLPTGEEAAKTPITCAVCHDPHVKTPNGSQLRNPKFSYDFYSYRTSTNFASQYNPEINICGQCHNARGATWKDTSRYPHYSPQYNMLLGNIGFTDDLTPIHSTHRDIQRQCTQCHTHTHEVPTPGVDNPVVVGHRFEARMNNCEPCHTEDSATARTQITQSEIKQLIDIVKQQMDLWAETKAPEDLRVKYGKLAWEYNTPGHLSNPTDDPAVRGPTSQEQAAVPDEIKQARFNIYMVLQDGSYGVHNGKYARFLLQIALEKVGGQLSQP
ncbi:MAG TPA: multiheme c-type cytochrome [Candidatus Paceibacterota bacterium]|nr:multiheme c-type cytochrome [Verrucomicrobiota bacterium]HRY47995.1 multiheme c-type cytochrome [Candidatus Paceibacterota bacterium]